MNGNKYAMDRFTLRAISRASASSRYTARDSMIRTASSAQTRSPARSGGAIISIARTASSSLSTGPTPAVMPPIWSSSAVIAA